MHLDIAAPQIILPETFTGDNTNMIVLDLGHLKFYNTNKMSPSENNSTANMEGRGLGLGSNCLAGIYNNNTR